MAGITPRNWALERKLEDERKGKEFESVAKFHAFLQGHIPKGVTVHRFKKMNADQAFTVIWFLQECCHLIPEQYEMCHDCKSIYASYSEGHYDAKRGRCYCASCAPR